MMTAKHRKLTVLALGVILCLCAGLPYLVHYRTYNLRDANGYTIGIRASEADKPPPVITFVGASGPAQSKAGEKVKVAIHCEFPDGSDPPSAILVSLRSQRLIFGSRLPKLRPSGGNGYDGEVELDGPSVPGKYVILVQSFDSVRGADSGRPKSVTTCEISTPLQVKAK